MKRGGRLPARSAKRKAADADPEVAVEREAVWRRSAGRCEVRARGCSTWATGQHHRLLERHGGPSSRANLVAVCAECHTASPDAIHRNVERSRELGLIIPSWQGAPSEPWRSSLLPPHLDPFA